MPPAVSNRRTPFIVRAALIVALAAPAAASLAQAPPPAAAAARRPAQRQVVGALVEVKWGATWRAATIKNNTRGEWYLVTYTDAATQEWVEPWRVRTPGSDYEIAEAPPNPPAKTSAKGELDPPPRIRPGPPPTENADAAAPLPVSWPLTPVDLAATPELSLPASANWAYAPAAADAAPKVRDASTSLQGGMQTDGSDTPIAFEPSGPVVLVGYLSRSAPKLPVAEVVDLASGRPVARAELDPASRPMSVAPSGKRLFCRAEGSLPGTMARVDVWDVESRGAPKHVVSFAPYGAEAAKDVERAIAIDADRVLTSNRDGHVIAWRVAAGSARPIWRARLGEGAFALSPDRKALAALSKGALLFLNVDDGKPVGTIETDARLLTALSFRGDGRRLAALSGPTLYAFDLEGGKQTASIGLPTPLAPLDVRHLAGDAAMVVGSLKSTVVDVAAKAVSTQYTILDAERTAVVGDRLIASLRGGGRWSLASWPLAPKPAPNAMAALPTVPAGAATRAKIELDLEVDEFAKRAVVDSLRRQVAARGWTLVEAGQPATVRILARVEEASPEPRTYEWMGKRETTQVTPRVTRLSIDVDGRVAWTWAMPSTAVAAPGTDKAITVQNVVDAARRPNVAFLKNTALPATLFMPVDAIPATVPQVTLRAAAVAAPN